MYKYFNVHNSNIDRGTVYFSLNTDIIDLEAYKYIFLFEKIKKLIKGAICKRNIMTAFGILQITVQFIVLVSVPISDIS